MLQLDLLQAGVPAAIGILLLCVGCVVYLFDIDATRTSHGVLMVKYVRPSANSLLYRDHTCSLVSALCSDHEYACVQEAFAEEVARKAGKQSWYLADAMIIISEAIGCPVAITDHY